MFAEPKEIRTPGQGSDPAARKRLWLQSEQLTGLAGAGPAVRVKARRTR